MGKTATDIAIEFAGWAQQQPTVGSCLFCPELPPFTGTNAEVHRALVEHRTTAHPEVTRRPRRRRPSIPGIIVFNGYLSDDQRQEVESERQRRMRLLGIEREPREDGVPFPD